MREIHVVPKPRNPLFWLAAVVAVLGCSDPDVVAPTADDTPVGMPRPTDGEYAVAVSLAEFLVDKDDKPIRRGLIRVMFRTLDGELVYHAKVNGLTMSQIHDEQLFPMDGGRRLRVVYSPDYPHDCWVDEILDMHPSWKPSNLWDWESTDYLDALE